MAESWDGKWYAGAAPADIITKGDIEKSGLKDRDLLTVIDTLEPRFLKAPPHGRVVVIVNGEIDPRPIEEVLTENPAGHVKQVRYVAPPREPGPDAVRDSFILVKLMSDSERRSYSRRSSGAFLQG
jgi:hypothetical protein